jgi:hypothetical protein
LRTSAAGQATACISGAEAEIEVVVGDLVSVVGEGQRHGRCLEARESACKPEQETLAAELLCGLEELAELGGGRDELIPLAPVIGHVTR